VILVSALNEELDRMEAYYGLDVFWTAFLSNRAGYLLGVPKVPLAELYEGCGTAISKMGGEVRLRSPIRRFRFCEERVSALELDGEVEETADVYVLAVQHQSALDLLPPAVAEQHPFANLRRLRGSPITGVHFWFDRDVMSEPLLAAVDTVTQWIFNKSRLYAGTGGRYLQLVISASYELMARSRQEIIEMCRGELANLLLATREADLINATVVKEASATFSPEPGSDKWRSGQRSPFSNLYLAGDWTQTGWPATMEGAVRSGYLAAEAILADLGVPRKLLRPDLAVEGLLQRYGTGKPELQ
jgi:zeta-carotene desaturase